MLNGHNQLSEKFNLLHDHDKVLSHLVKPSSMMPDLLGKDFRFQDIYKDRARLTFTKGTDQRYRNYLVPYELDRNKEMPTSMQRINQNILFQIVGIRDVSVSIINYIDRLTELTDLNSSFADRQRKNTSASKVVRAVDVGKEDEDEDALEDESRLKKFDHRLFKLTLQDAFGNLCFGMETEPLQFLRRSGQLYPVPLGSKLLVQGGLTSSLFGCIQLSARNTKYLGGELDYMNYELFERELVRLKKEIHYGEK